MQIIDEMCDEVSEGEMHVLAKQRVTEARVWNVPHEALNLETTAPAQPGRPAPLSRLSSA